MENKYLLEESDIETEDEVAESLELARSEPQSLMTYDSNYGYTFNHLAKLIKYRHIQSLKEAINDRNIQLFDEGGRSILHEAAASNSEEIMNILLNDSRCVDLLNYHDPAGTTPLVIALQTRSYKTIEVLCMWGADPTVTHTKSGGTALHLTALSGDVTAAKLLLKYYPSPDFINSINNLAASYQHILTDKLGEKKNVGLITLNRPKALNALCDALISELADAVSTFDKDESIGALIITGSEKAFAAGADIKEMMNQTFAANIKTGLLERWNDIANCKKPVIAAVNGYALGGGCELALMCDMVFAGDKAKFGQPEIAIGTIPGAGGTQRIARSAGKSKAMEMCLTGNQITAEEAERMGIVSRVFPADNLIAETLKIAEKICSHSPLIVQLCKDSVNKAFETTLQEGLRYEKKIFYATFATNDQKEGMKAFVEKRPPNFSNS